MYQIVDEEERPEAVTTQEHIRDIETRNENVKQDPRPDTEIIDRISKTETIGIPELKN